MALMRRIIIRSSIMVLLINYIFNTMLFAQGAYGTIATHRYSSGDDPTWCLPHYDDSRWIELSNLFDRNLLDIIKMAEIGWHRIHFHISTVEEKNIGIYLGSIGDADEVFLNGHKIGGEGVIGDRFVEASFVKRLYLIPNGLLKEGDNLLAIRVMNTYPKGGLFDTKPIVDDYNRLLLFKMIESQGRQNIEIFILTFNLLVLLFLALILVCGIREKSYVIFVIFTFIYLAVTLLNSGFLYEHGFKTHFIQKLIFSLTAAMIPITLIYIIETYKMKYALIIKSIIIVSIILSGLFLFSFEWKTYKLLIWLWTFLAFISGLIASYYVLKGISTKNPESIPIGIGFGILIVAVVYWLTEILNIVSPKSIYGYSLSDFAVLGAFSCLSLSIIMKFVNTMKGFNLVSEKVLSSHEDERARISRDLHDGIGQSLAAIKLRLQMIRAMISSDRPKEANAVDEMIESVSDSINELRTIAKDLKPAYIKDIDIIDAFNQYAKYIQKKVPINVEINLTIHDSIKLQPHIKENLYRIFQEALTNVIKHSQAKHVWVSFRQKGFALIMTIEDDGIGFNPHEELKGMGLSTMKERITLIGGRLSIKSAPGKGTKIRLVLPLK